MVDQLNRLVGDLLASGAELYLPGVGTLYVERRAAQRLSKRSILPPARVVAFSSQQRELSLVDEIARVAGCEKTEAQEIYDRWLSRTYENEILTIEGVGTLKFKNFTPDPAFDKRLNPQGHEPVRVKPARGLDWVMWTGIAAVVIAACAGGLVLWKYYGGETPEKDVVVEVVVANTADGTNASADSLEQADATAMSQPAEVALANRPEAASAQQPDTPSVRQSGTTSGHQSQVRPAGTTDAPASLVSGRRYVVFGVFSTRENAARAVAGVVAKDASMQCGVYRFGEKFMVSPFDADNTEACARFIREKRDRFPDLWTYTAR